MFLNAYYLCGLLFLIWEIRGIFTGHKFTETQLHLVSKYSDLRQEDRELADKYVKHFSTPLVYTGVVLIPYHTLYTAWILGGLFTPMAQLFGVLVFISVVVALIWLRTTTLTQKMAVNYVDSILSAINILSIIILAFL